MHDFGCNHLGRSGTADCLAPSRRSDSSDRTGWTASRDLAVTRSADSSDLYSDRAA